MNCSAMRKRYFFRFFFRLAVFAGVVWLYLRRPGDFQVLDGWAFFRRPSWLHLPWLVWVGDMLTQLLPMGRWIALGSQKQFGRYARPAGTPPDSEALRRYVRGADRGALKVLVLWEALTAAIGLLWGGGVFRPRELLLCCAFFYVCDLICVLFWCPFRALLMKNRCCTTCRIFNWDHLMMFLPLLFAPGFYTWSLLLLSVLVFAVWEVAFRRHPERFWEGTNRALTCGRCTDRLCGRSGRAVSLR